jgi:uncharacterized protein YlzI (FlbEa/FlbD family)
MHLINLKQVDGLTVKVNPDWIQLIKPYGSTSIVVLRNLEIEVEETPQEIYDRISNSADLYKHSR